MEKVKIYATQLNAFDSLDKYQFILSCLTPEKKIQIQQLKRLEDKLRSLKAEWLIRTLAGNILHLSPNELILKPTIYGKPYIENAKGLYFNLSHSEKWIACALSSDEVGIDIEKISQIDFSTITNFFSTEEIKALNSISKSNKIAYFYDLWTLKESFLKTIGKGLSLPLDSFSITFNNVSIELKSNLNYSVFFKQYQIDPDYKLSVCSKIGSFEDSVEIIHF